jgi:hypothetical protein
VVTVHVKKKTRTVDVMAMLHILHVRVEKTVLAKKRSVVVANQLVAQTMVAVDVLVRMIHH